jgi:mitotic spindle assembly checkpoint protein MAD1
MFGARNRQDESHFPPHPSSSASIDASLAGAGLKSRPFLIPETPTSKHHDLSLSAIAANTSVKKRRISELILEDTDSIHDFTINAQNMNYLTGINAASRAATSATSTAVVSSITTQPHQQPKVNASSTLKLQLQVDELKLTNEQLKEQLKSYKTEHEVFKDQSARQLKFLEDLNIKYKAEVESARQKYYDEKKKWQTKLRESEDAYKKLQLRTMESTNATADPGHALNYLSSPDATATTSATAQRLQSLEALISDTQAEAKRNLSFQRVTQLEQELKLYTSATSASSLSTNAHALLNDDLNIEHRKLRKQYQDLETMYRRKCKEADKLQQQVKNQNMLEEELATCQTNLSLSQDTITFLQSMEIDHRRLLEECKTWKQVFHSLSASPKTSSSSAVAAASGNVKMSEDETASVSPTRVVSMVQEMQHQCLLLQDRIGELECTLISLRSSLCQSDSRLTQCEQEKLHLQTQFDQIQVKHSVVTQQTRLYEKEIVSLRTLLQSFDMEFAIGKPEATFMLQAKDQLLETARQEVDAARQRVNQLSQNLLSSQEAVQQLQQQLMDKQQVETASLQALAANEIQQKAEIQQWKDRYLAVQEITGVDFVPHETRILHFKKNPSAPLFRQQEAESVDRAETEEISPVLDVSLPSEVIKRYRQETRTLKAQVYQLQQELLALAQQSQYQLGSGEEAASSQSPNASMMYFGTNTSMLPSKLPVTNPTNNNNNNNASSSSAPSAGSTTNSSVVDPAKLNQRLKEMFKEKIATFREAVYLLTGFKMELFSAEAAPGQTVNRLKIKSMYAESPEDYLMFQLSENGPELLESEFANRIDETLIQHLQRYQSVPAFLANVTMTLFENSTFMG